MREPECQHLQSEVRWRLQSNGVRIYQRQCLCCHQVVGTAVKHSEVKGEVPPFDVEAREAYWRNHCDANLRRLDDERAQRLEEYRARYRDYLQTAKWARKRSAVLKRDCFVCQAAIEGCTHNATDVHHKTYANVFDEPLFDLIAVCRNCHERLHEKE